MYDLRAPLNDLLEKGTNGFGQKMRRRFPENKQLSVSRFIVSSF